MYSLRFLRVVHEVNKCLPTAEVLWNATTRIGQNQHTYNPLTNNCEHFANECKLGDKTCHQKWTVIEIFVGCLISTVASYVIETLQSRSKTVAIIIKAWKEWLAEHSSELTLVAALLLHGLLFRLHAKAKRESLLSAKFGSWLAFFVPVIIEAYLLYRDCSDTSAKLDEGKLSHEDARRVIVKRVCAAVCSIYVH